MKRIKIELEFRTFNEVPEEEDEIIVITNGQIHIGKRKESFIRTCEGSFSLFNLIDDGAIWRPVFIEEPKKPLIHFNPFSEPPKDNQPILVFIDNKVWEGTVARSVSGHGIVHIDNEDDLTFNDALRINALWAPKL